MRKSSCFSVIIIIILFILVTSPATAEDGTQISHTIRYDISGLISIDRTVGHYCYTGAEKKQTILGYGEVAKWEDVRIVRNIMTNQEETTWNVPADAVSGLTVTTTIDLCARPLSTAAANYVYLPGLSEEAQLILNQSAPDFLKAIQNRLGDENFILQGDLISPYHPLVVDEVVETFKKTDQIWGTRLSTLPGNDGFYEVDFRAAYGPGPHEVGGFEVEPGVVIFYDEEYMWWFDETKEDGYDSGRFYVGNYFHIDQHAYTSGGNMQRLISLSSPFSNAYLVDRVNVTGRAEIKEALSMENLKAGPDARTLEWHDLF